MKKTPHSSGEQPPAEAAKRTRVRRTLTDEQVILTMRQAATLLGWTERATWQAAYRGKIPARRLGKKVYVVRRELVAFIETRPLISPQESDASQGGA